MTPFIIINVVLMSAIVVAIVGMLAAAVHTSRPQGRLGWSPSVRRAGGRLGPARTALTRA